MGNGMPFVIEKGPVWEFFDRQYAPGGNRGNVEQRLAILNGLRRPVEGPAPQDPAADWGTLFLEASSAQNPVIRQQLEDHITNDWFTGIAPNGTNGWLNWDTNPAEIICRAWARAIEVSLGITQHVELPGPGRAGQVEPVPEARPSDVTRLWPIEYWWVCPLPVFQCWMGYRRVKTDRGIGEGDGLVTFIWATPAPAWSYLARFPAADGEWIDDDDQTHYGPLGRADFPDGSRSELYHRNMASSGLMLVGHEETVVEPVGVAAPDCLSMERGGGRASVQCGSPDELNERARVRAANSENKFVLDFPVLRGAGRVVTVSPYDDVGGYSEVRED